MLRYAAYLMLNENLVFTSIFSRTHHVKRTSYLFINWFWIGSTYSTHKSITINLRVLCYLFYKKRCFSLHMKASYFQKVQRFNVFSSTFLSSTYVASMITWFLISIPNICMNLKRGHQLPWYSVWLISCLKSSLIVGLNNCLRYCLCLNRRLIFVHWIVFVVQIEICAFCWS